MSAKNDHELFVLQCQEDARRFGAALFMKVDEEDDLVTGHPALKDETKAGMWRIKLVRDPVHQHLINAQIEDGDCLIATVTGAVFIDGQPCCANLDNARRIVEAGQLAWRVPTRVGE